MMNKTKEQLKDMLAFIRFVHNRPDWSDKHKYMALISTLGHDLNGIINEHRCFLPRTSGYSRLED